MSALESSSATLALRMQRQKPEREREEARRDRSSQIEHRHSRARHARLSCTEAASGGGGQRPSASAASGFEAPREERSVVLASGFHVPLSVLLQKESLCHERTRRLFNRFHKPRVIAVALFK